MGSSSVGEIALDLVVNHNFSGITNIAKKAGAAIAAAFSVKGIVDFGKECLELGSDLAEVQNVVDVTFPAMSARVDEFAKSAAASFGMSETMAKKYTGTFGAMAKAFGFSESAAYDMSTALTGLAGDVASFYNLSQDEAYTKLKSVFTGETESLKDLGVVMTQTALDSYALANGFGKTTSAMSEAEKVSLRYAFVQDQLSAAAGDFTRTSDSWANQVRILSLQFDSLKATIGQGLINVFTPVIKMINTVIGKLAVLANAFKSFTDMLTGKKSSAVSTAGADAEQSLSSASDAADSLTDSTAGVGSAAKKASKEMKALMGFDEIQKIDDSSSSDSGSSGSGASGTSIETIDTGNNMTESLPDESDFKWFDSIKKKIDELTNTWKNGFVAGLGDAGPRIEDIKTKIGSIKDSISSIFTDSSVTGAANGMISSFTYVFGQIAGSAASIGLTIAQNLIGGISIYLSGNTDRIKEYLVNMFDIKAETATIAGNFSAAVANIFSAFGSKNGQMLTANLTGIFADAFMGVSELCAKFSLDILNIITKPFIDNQDGFKTALDGFLGTAATVCGTIKDTIDTTFSTIMTVYDEHIKPFLDSITTGLSTITEKFLEFWNTNIQPIMDSLAEKFDSVMKEHVQPIINKAIELVGSIADALKVLWEQVLVPVINWIIENILPVLLPIFNGIYQGVLTAFGYITDAIGGLIDVIKGIIDFVVGVFTGDWDKAWGAISDIVTGIMNAISAAIKTALTAISTVVTTILNTIKAVFTSIFKGISSYVKTCMTGIKNTISGILGSVKNGISTILGNIKTTWMSIWTSMKTTVVSIFNGIWSSIKGIINSILGGIQGMANGVVNGINTVIDALNNLSFTMPDWLPGGLGGKSFGFSIPKLPAVNIPKLAQGGYVKKNTPQLAMIGDNRHQGEVVSPEDKLMEMAYKAASMAGGNSDISEVLTLLRKLISLIEDAGDIVLIVDGQELARASQKGTLKLQRKFAALKLSVE